LRDNDLFEIDEPFKKLLTQGMVQAAAYKNNKTGKYVSPYDITDLSILQIQLTNLNSKFFSRRCLSLNIME